MADTWGYREGDDNWKSVDELMENLRDVNDKGGNYLLNVGPDGLGRIPEPSVERLLEMGRPLRTD
ncbi:MAG: alpha-L-fucosidase [Phycisphaerae bacterium]